MVFFKKIFLLIIVTDYLSYMSGDQNPEYDS